MCDEHRRPHRNQSGAVREKGVHGRSGRFVREEVSVTWAVSGRPSRGHFLAFWEEQHATRDPLETTGAPRARSRPRLVREKPDYHLPGAPTGREGMVRSTTLHPSADPSFREEGARPHAFRRTCLRGMDSGAARVRIERHRRRVRRGLLVAALVILVVAAAIGAGLYVVPGLLQRPSSPPSYPALTVSNGVVNCSFNWTIVGGVLPKLGSFNVTTSFVENNTANVSTLRLDGSIWPYEFSLEGEFDYYMDVYVTGNVSPGIVPTSITLSIENLNTSIANVGAFFDMTGPQPTPPPNNISGYGVGGGVSPLSYDLANVSGTHGSRYYFGLPGEPETGYLNPANGTVTWDTIQIRALLGGLGRAIFCDTTMEIQAAMPANGPGPG